MSSQIKNTGPATARRVACLIVLIFRESACGRMPGWAAQRVAGTAGSFDLGKERGDERENVQARNAHCSDTERASLLPTLPGSVPQPPDKRQS